MTTRADPGRPARPLVLPPGPTPNPYARTREMTTPRIDTETGQILDEPRIRPFADFLREQAKGNSHEELSEGLRDLVARVNDTGKKGSITYVVTIEPTKGTTALTVSDEIKLKLPEHDRDASLFFTDRDGNLARNDPDQLSFDSLREIPGGTPDHADLKDAR